MRRALMVLTLSLGMLAAANSASAQFYGAAPYPEPYGPAPYGAQEQYPVLKRLLIGAGIFGLGFVTGRATAPKYDDYGYGYDPGFRGPVHRPSFGGHPFGPSHHRGFGWR